MGISVQDERLQGGGEEGREGERASGEKLLAFPPSFATMQAGQGCMGEGALGRAGGGE